jgi:hypothetical protein
MVGVIDVLIVMQAIINAHKLTPHHQQQLNFAKLEYLLQMLLKVVALLQQAAQQLFHLHLLQHLHLLVREIY